ncbi:hypothetical protein LXL04_027564 [Taraxacum kok-saghyz]
MASTSTVKRLSAVEKYPNWLEIPHELMANILKRLGDVEILNSAVKVCTTWRRIGRDPAMWKFINIKFAPNADYDIEALTKQAVHLSSGELSDISLEVFGSDDLLHHVVSRSSKLNSLCLTNCNNITGSGLNHALKRAPQLEKLYITYTTSMMKPYEVLVPNCPNLKSFKLDKAYIYVGIANDDDALAIANTMPELRHLQLYGNAMSEIGLKAILDGCPHLESLDIRTCYNVDIHGDELKLSMERLKSFKGPNDSTENCGFHRRIFENVDSDGLPDSFFHEYDITQYTSVPSYIDYFIDYYSL